MNSPATLIAFRHLAIRYNIKKTFLINLDIAYILFYGYAEALLAVSTGQV